MSTGAALAKKAAASHLSVLTLAWPIALAMFGETAIGLVDTRLVGGLGVNALAAVGVGSSLFYLFFVTALGFMRGVKVVTAHAVGAGHPTIGLSYAQAGAAIGLLLGLAGAWALQHATVMLQLMQIRAEVVAPAATFLAARAWGLPAACALAALIEHRQGLGSVWGTTLIVVVGNLFNAVLAYALIYGHLGLPALGVAGAGLGSAASETLQCAMALTWFLHSRQAQVAAASAGVPSRPPWPQVLRELLALGLPTAFHFGAECLAFVTFTGIIGALPPAEVAAHQIAMSINRTAFLPGIAVGEAACILVGQALGRGDGAAARAAVFAAVRVAVAFMALCGVVYLLIGMSLVRFFTHDMSIAPVAVRLLHLAALFQVADAVSLVMRGALRGAKDVRAAALIGISILWTCVPGAAWLLGRVAGLGIVGGWCGFMLADVMSALACSLRFWRGPSGRLLAPSAQRLLNSPR